jgi:hypothetical protein
MARDDIGITLRLPKDIHSRLVTDSARYERSLNGQIVYTLRSALGLVIQSPNVAKSELLQAIFGRAVNLGGLHKLSMEDIDTLVKAFPLKPPTDEYGAPIDGREFDE